MIQRFLNLFVLTLAGLLAAGGALRAEATDTAPDFNQVYELLRANLPNASDAELNSAAVKGLLRQLHGRATLVGGTPGTVLEAGAQGIVVACGRGSLRIEELQRAGGRRLSPEEYLRGHPVAPGERFEI